MSNPAALPDSAARPIRVCLVQPTLARYRVPVFRELARQPGIDLRVIFADTPGLKNVAPDGFAGAHEPMTIRRLAGHPLYWQQSQIRYARRAACDVLVLNWDVHYASTLPALLRARRAGVGTVLWGHGYSRNESWLKRRPRAWLGAAADALVFYNETGRNLFAGDGFDPRRLFVAYNSIDHAPIDAAIRRWHEPGRLDAWRHERGLDDGRPMALYVGRLYPERQAERLIEAAARLWADGARFRVAFVGDAQLEYGETLRALVAERGLADCVRFEPGTYDEDALAPWFLSSRVFPFPTFAGLSLHHALAYGLPVLCTDRLNANAPEIEALRPDENGLTYRDGDADDFARQLGRMLTDDPLSARLAANARRVIDETFNVPNMVRGLADAIRFVHARRNGARP